MNIRIHPAENAADYTDRLVALLISASLPRLLADLAEQPAAPASEGRSA